MAPVHDAARRNDVEALAALLDGEPSLIDAWDQVSGFPLIWGQPLHFACYDGSVEAAQLLLDRGASISSTYTGVRWRMTPLILACEAGRAAVVALLLARGADPTNPEAKSTVLMNTSYSFGLPQRGCDYAAVVRLLLEDGRVPVNAQDENGCTALWFACHFGLIDVARVLLVEGRADHTIADYRGFGPVQMAGHTALRGLLQWYEGELQRPYLLSKARAVVDATESISKAPEKVGAKTEAEAQKAREEAAPVYLRGRVKASEALPEVEVVGYDGRKRDGVDEQERENREEECKAVLEFVVRELKDDLVVEMMEGLTYRRWVPE